MFNIRYVCYRCGDRQILCLIYAVFVTILGIGRFFVQCWLCVLQMWGSADFVFNISYVFYSCGDRQIFLNSVEKQ